MDLALWHNHSALADYPRLKGAYGGGEGRPRRPGFESVAGGGRTNVASDEALARRIAEEEYLAARREARRETNRGETARRRGRRSDDGDDVETR